MNLLLWFTSFTAHSVSDHSIERRRAFIRSVREIQFIPMLRMHREFELNDDRSRIDLDRVHRWLAASYWSPGIKRDIVERAMHGSSLVIGAYLKGEQVGYTRVVSDKATFGWLADVYVDQPHRGQGLGRAMVRFALEDPEHQTLRRWVLGTKDAHGVYAALGFAPPPEPQRFMMLRPDPNTWSDTPELA